MKEGFGVSDLIFGEPQDRVFKKMVVATSKGGGEAFNSLKHKHVSDGIIPQVRS